MFVRLCDDLLGGIQTNNNWSNGNKLQNVTNQKFERFLYTQNFVSPDQNAWGLWRRILEA